MLDGSAPYLLDVTRLIWRRWVGRQPTGIDRVCLAYVDHFGANAQAVVQHRQLRRILDRETSAALFGLLSSPGDAFRRRFAALALRFAMRGGDEGRGRFYLNIGHTGLNDDNLRLWLGRTKVRPVYFVHDLIPITHSQFCRPGEQERHRDRMRTVLTTACGIIANSEATLDDLSDFALQEGFSKPPTLAAQLGSDAFPVASRIPDREPATFVILGTIEARKNHMMLLQLWSELIKRMGTTAPRLLIIGHRGWECHETFALLDSNEELKTAVMEINRCDDSALAEHLAGARALLFPSLVEGYGLPLVEALSAGVPVIANDLPVFREIAGDVPDYIDPPDVREWERTISSYMDSGSLARKQQLQRLANFRAPTWADHFAAVDSWMSTL